MYPFGYGLSYTTFEYSDISCENREISLDDLKAGEKFRVSVKVKNVGGYDAKEIVECYVRDNFSSFTRPIKELKGFKKPFIKAGDEALVEFEIGYDELGYFNPREFNVEKGEFTVYVGENCLTDRKITIEVK